jgi:hypothetical protein
VLLEAGSFNRSVDASAPAALSAFHPYPTPCDDCVVLSGGSGVVRSGSFDGQASDVVTAAQATALKVSCSSRIGFRCARP